MVDTISKSLNEIMNAKRAGKETYVLKRISKLLIDVLDIMKNNDYLDYKIIKGKFDSAEIKIKKLNECRSIRPRFFVNLSDIKKYERRYLPSRNFGFIVVSTDKGLMTNDEAIEKKLGGCLIAYFY